MLLEIEFPSDTRATSRAAAFGGRLGYSFRVILRPQPEGGFTAFAPDLPGAVSQGESLSETLANMKDALAGLIEAYGSANIPFLDEPDYVWHQGDIETRVAVDV